MKILITGATGLIGRKLSAHLAQSGHEVSVIVRKIPEREFSFKPKIFIWPEIESPFPEEALSGQDAVVHLLGEPIDLRWTKENKNRIYNSRILSTQKIVQLIKSKNIPIKVFIQASAVGFYGDRGEELLTEDAIRGSGFLSDVCYDWENSIHSLPPEIRKITLRTGVVLDRDAGALNKMLPVFKFGIGGKLGQGMQYFPWIHWLDEVRAIEYLINQNSLSGIFNCVAPTFTHNAHFTASLCRKLKKSEFFPVPKFFLKIILGEQSQLVLSSQKVSSQKLVFSGFKFNFTDIDNALEDLLK